MNEIYTRLAGHPLRGWPAPRSQRFWFVESVDSPLPSPPLLSPPLPSPPLPSPPLTHLPCTPLPSPALPCPALPSPPLPSPPLPSPPSPPLPSPPSLPPSRVPNLIKLGPAVWPKRASVAPPWRSASENESSQP